MLQGRGEQPALVIHEAMSSMLLGSSSPFQSQVWLLTNPLGQVNTVNTVAMEL
jgi:hypothetical protein